MKRFIKIYIIVFGFVLNASAQTDVVFNPMGGIYTEGVVVDLTAENEESRIYYTLDGSVPGSGSFRYTKPIKVDNVAAIRAVAYTNGKRSKVITQSYFCDREYSLPVISITTNPGNFWDYSTGIYVKGCCADTIEPYIGANFWKSWEKPINIEMYDKKGDLCFNQGAGMSLFGGFSRALPQKSLAIIARKKYGNSRFDYKLFKERDHKKYKSFILRNSGGDFQRTHLRDAFMTQMVAPTGIAYQAYEPAVVFLNGQYWGIQNIREKINEHFLEQNYDVDKDNVDILRHNGVKRHGYSTQYKYLLKFLRTHDLSDDKNVEELSKFMDIDDYIRYNICEVYSDNRDAGGNIRYFRERSDKGKWRWVFYDLDLGLGNNNYTGYKRNTLQKFTNANAEAWPDPSWSTFIIRKLLENKKLRNQYVVTTCDFLNTVMNEKNAADLLAKLTKVIETEMPYHVKKWNTSVENWRYHLTIVETFVKERPKYMREHLAQKFNLGKTVNIKIIVPAGDVCKIEFNTLKIEEDFNGIYFENVPVSIKVKPKHDYEFVGWKNRDEKSNLLTVSPTGDLILQPIIEPKQMSALKDSLFINEISFYQSTADSTNDWIELYNKSNQTIQLDSFSITDSKFSKGFFIPQGSIIAPKDYLIVAKNKVNYLAKFNIDSNKVVGNLDFGLSTKGEHLKLYDNKFLVLDSLTFNEYNDEPDSMFTISLVHPDSSRYLQSHWNYEHPTPFDKSHAYQYYLYQQEQKAIWQKRLYIGGGSFFFICLGGILWFRYSRKKKINNK
jgi:hypothetical protein